MMSKDIYVLAREASEIERLNHQNKFLNSCVGYILHPTIHSALPAAPKVADLATGTGAFLIDLAAELSSASQLHGWDISDAALTAKIQLPANVVLSLADAKQKPPPELRGQYDVVCIRLLFSALMPEDWAKVATHAAALLKVGGALQWIESDFAQLQVPLRSHPNANTTFIDRANRFAEVSLSQAGWSISNLPAVLEAAGVRDVRRDVTSTDREINGREEGNLIGSGAKYALLRYQARSGVQGAPTEEELEELREGMEKELREGAYFRADMHPFFAFKRG